MEEETGVSSLSLISDGIGAVQIIPVENHFRRGAFVSSHLHLDVCYLFEASSKAELRANILENTGVKWIPINEAPFQTKEARMVRIYKKLNDLLSLERK